MGPSVGVSYLVNILWMMTLEFSGPPECGNQTWAFQVMTSIILISYIKFAFGKYVYIYICHIYNIYNYIYIYYIHTTYIYIHTPHIYIHHINTYNYIYTICIWTTCEIVFSSPHQPNSTALLGLPGGGLQ